MPRNQTEKVPLILKEGWIVVRAQTDWVGRQDPDTVLISLPWNQEFANHCYKLWRVFSDAQRSAENSGVKLSRLEFNHSVDSYPIVGSLSDWLDANDPVSGSPREDHFWEDGLFVTEPPALVPPHRGSEYSQLIVMNNFIHARVFPNYEGGFETDCLISRRCPELWQKPPS